MDIRQIEERQAVSWQVRSRWRQPFSVHGVVVSRTENGVDIVPVNELTHFIKCYDDPGAKRETDSDNIRLKDCPPPFQIMCDYSETGQCFADTKGSSMISASFDELAAVNAVILDGGKKISERDLHEILNHPWPEQLEKEKIMDDKTNARWREASALLPSSMQFPDDFGLDL